MEVVIGLIELYTKMGFNYHYSCECHHYIPNAMLL